MCFNKRKIISVLLSAAMLLSTSNLPVLADETEAVTEVIETVEKTETEIEEPTVLSDTETEQAVEPTYNTYPESEHDYSNNMEEWFEYTYPDDSAAALRIHFAEESYLESNYDNLYVYDSQDNLVASYTGDYISNSYLDVKGNSFKIYMTTDGSVTYYGFKIDEIVPLDSADFDYTTVIAQSLSAWSDYYYPTMPIGESFQMSYDIYPSNSTEAVFWSTSDPNIATVDENGLVTVRGYGLVEIIATTSESGCSCYSSFNFCVPSFLNADSVYLNAGESFQLRYISVYDSDDYINFGSENTDVATVDENGNVCAVSAGSTGIWFHDVYCWVVVGEYTNRPMVDSLRMVKGEIYRLPIAGYSGDGYIDGYSLDPYVAEYSYDGTITANEEGSTNIEVGGYNITVEVFDFSRYYEPTYTVSNGVLTAYSGYSSDIYIPSEVDGETVTAIGSYVFSDIKADSIILPDTVTELQDRAFYNCSCNYLELPSSVNTIGYKALGDCAINNVNYTGTRENWLVMYIDSGNEIFIEATSENGNIYTYDDLCQIATAVNGGYDQAGRTFYLMNDIDLSGISWTPIGTDISHRFRGSFIGQNHTISNLTLSGAHSYCGFFGDVYGGTICDLNIVDAKIDVQNNTDSYNALWCGILAGWASDAHIDNCNVYGVIYANLDENPNAAINCIGGLTGRTSGAILSNCFTDVSITVNNDSGADIGGLTGYVYGTISDCNSNAIINYIGTARAWIGGITGWQASDSTETVNNTASGAIRAVCCQDEAVDVYIGGLIGYNLQAVENNTSYVDIFYYSKNDIDVGSGFGFDHVGFGNNAAYGSVELLKNNIPDELSAEILDEINKAGSIAELETIIGKYANALDLNMSLYYNSSQLEQSFVLEKIITSLPYCSLEVFVAQFDKVLCGVYEQSKPSSSGSGGGGGSSCCEAMNEVIDERVEPTCTETGLTEGSHCSECGFVFQEQEVIPAKGHTEVMDKGYDPTCTKNGLTEGSHCSECGEIIVKQEVIPAKEHTEVTDKGYDPTCTETGLTEGSHCSECGEIIVKQEAIPAKGHTEVTDKGYDPTCTKNGLTEGSHCSECGCVLQGQEVIPTKGHTEVTDKGYDPTCTENGLTEGSHCSECGCVLQGQEVIPAKGHTEVKDEGYDPTCTENGLTEGSHCSECGEIIVKQEEIPAKGHTEVTDKGYDPTCTETGLTEGSHCSECGEIIVKQEVIPAKGHTEVIDKRVEPTYTQTGLTEGSHCSECGKVITAQEIIPMLINENAPKITITDIKTRPGNEIQVTVDLANNTGFASMGIEVGYNSEVMTLTNVTSNSGVGGTFTPGPNYTINPFNMGWDSASNISYNGNLATLTFMVNADAPDGVYPITLDYYKGVNGDYVDGDDINYDENFKAVGFVYVSGNVVVASYTPGDLTGDDKVNNKDATYLLRYLAKWELPDLVAEALDIDASGSVNNKDATILLRYLAGWDVTLH